jgi:hypothetical protein
LGEQIGDLKMMSRLIQELFGEKERSLEKMAQVVTSHHQVVMKLTQIAVTSGFDRVRFKQLKNPALSHFSLKSN